MDSTGRVSMKLGAVQYKVVRYWFACGNQYFRMRLADLLDDIDGHTPSNRDGVVNFRLTASIPATGIFHDTTFALQILQYGAANAESAE